MISVRDSSIALALGCLGAGFLLHLLAAGEHVKFENIGLGINTSGVFLKHAGDAVHCVYVSTGADCVEATRQADKRATVLWLGASQLHGVNAFKDGDKTAPWLVHDAVLKDDAWVVTFSQPNANFQEHLVIFEELLTRMKVDALVLAAVFDDMKEVGVRDEIRDGIEAPALRQRLETSDFGRRLVTRFGRSIADNAAPAAAPIFEEPGLAPAEVSVAQGTQAGAAAAEGAAAPAVKSDGAPGPEHAYLQQRVESTLDALMRRHSALWEDRGELRSRLIWLSHAATRRALEFRNIIFGIDSTQWMIKVEGAQYDLNFAAFGDLLARAHRYGIPVLVYVAPRPTNAHFPYDLDHYSRFKSAIGAVALSNGARLINLEDSAPGDVWGQIDNGVGVLVTDVFHFTAQGHAGLAGALTPAVRELVRSVRAASQP
jgi:hypothetical protein